MILHTTLTYHTYFAFIISSNIILKPSLKIMHLICIYSRTSMAETPLEPLNYVRDGGSSS